MLTTIVSTPCLFVFYQRSYSFFILYRTDVIMQNNFDIMNQNRSRQKYFKLIYNIINIKL